jgi:hypothetical protein
MTMFDLAPGHAFGLVGGLLAAAAWLLAVRFLCNHRYRARYAAAPGSVRAAALLMIFTAGVHLALVPHHLDDGPITAPLFLVNGIAFLALAVLAFRAWWWRRAAAALLVATIVAYLFYVAVGLEGPDQVGIATKLVELAALGLALVPAPHERRPSRRGLRWAAVAAGVPALTVVTGVTVWATDLLRPGTGHHHVGAVVQAASPVATPDQQAAANRLLADTTAAIEPYRDARVAWSAGYRPGLGGGAVHWMNPAYSKGPVLDPRHPQGLVYVRNSSGGWVLTGAMFQMPRMGEFGPDPGGPITAWHQHVNLCVSPIGFAIGLASPYAGCPVGAVGMSFPAMLHVWIVENPAGGPFAIDLDPKTIRAIQREA